MIRQSKLILLLGVFIISLTSCNGDQKTSGLFPTWKQRNEAWQDSIQFQHSLDLKKEVKNFVTADAETIPVIAGVDDDAADDPAWFTVKDDSVRFIIAASNKVAGIHLYEVNGDSTGFYNVGRINNIDARTVKTGENDSLTVLAGSNRDQNSILIIAPPVKNGNKEPVTTNIPTTLDDVYGFCLYHSHISGNLYAFVNSKSGEIEQYLLDIDTNYVIGFPVRKLAVRSQPEGMVADDRTGVLYVGEEKGGIHIFDAEPEGNHSSSLIKGSDQSNSFIHYDIEGLALYKTGESGGYLIASSQGNFSFAVFDLTTQLYITSFRIEGSDPDSVEETDGIEIIDTYVSLEYPEGILIVQDGFNTSQGKPEAQNFKIIDWRQIRSLLTASSGV